MDSSLIRNFCIIAHIDHGKSTLADRFLELTETVAKREMKEQVLDQMDIERERGITIKLTPVLMKWQNYYLNLIDTPGHVDFNYEVSRSLACVEGAILLVDATQGIQAQTLANLHLAQNAGLVIIPVINKIDLPNAQIEQTAEEIANLLNINKSTIHQISAKTGTGVKELLNSIIKLVPPPKSINNQFAALIFDSHYDEWRGVVASVRIMSGSIKAGDKYWLTGSKITGEVLEVGIYNPKSQSVKELTSGQIGYLVTGVKKIELVRVGDTVAKEQGQRVLAGYQEPKPMVFAGFYPAGRGESKNLRDSLTKLKLNDASLIFEPENSQALGFGFRVGFLGLLHLEITKERLKREFAIQPVITSPSVAYQIELNDNQRITVKGAAELPPEYKIKKIYEPYVIMEIICPQIYLGNVMTLVQEYRGVWQNTNYLSAGVNKKSDRAILKYYAPLSTLLLDFYDQLKSVSQGYASLNYEFLEYRPCCIKKLDILIADEIVESLATLVYEDEAYFRARAIVTKLKEIIPRQMFEVKIQASLGGKIIAAERLSAMRKDVLKRASSGGDVTRKIKLLQKQKRGKKRMREQGHVTIPQEAYLSLLTKQIKTE